MVKKMIEALKKRYSNLGLPEEVIAKVAPMAILGLADDADEAAIDARASESYISDMLKSMQSQADKMRTLEGKVKDLEGKNKGVDQTDPALKEVLNLLKEQKEANTALQTRLEKLEGADKAKSHEELVQRIANEIGMKPAMLDLCKGGLSSDMDEKGIRDALGAAQKKFVELGVQVEEGQQQRITTEKAKEEADRKAAADWVKEHQIKD